MKTTPEWIWQNGEFVPWKDATVHVMAHALHYGSSVFEGIRTYSTPDGPAIFRLDDHLQRLFDSCKMYRMNCPYTYDEIKRVCGEVIAKNNICLLYTSPSPRDQRGSRMPSSA